MSNLSFLKFNYGFSGKPSFSSKNVAKNNSFISKQTSNAEQSFQPNAEEMKWVFQKFDTNKDGKVSLEEYKAAAMALNRGIRGADAAKAFRVMDSDGDGFIDFKEFMEMFKAEGRTKETEIKNAFQVFDLNGDGKISAEELFEVLKMLGESCSLSSCKKMVIGVDGNGDGFIDMNEFMMIMENVKNGFQVSDLNGEGKTSAEDLSQVLKRTVAETNPKIYEREVTTKEIEIKDGFQVFALKGQGKTSVEDSSQVLKRSGVKTNQRMYQTEGRIQITFQVN